MSQQPDIRRLTAEIEEGLAFLPSLTAGMARVIVGQQRLVRSLLTGLLAGGHILLEGVPGLAKTRAVKTLAALVKADFSRIQFTPDLLPADVVGTVVYSQRTEQFSVRRGPVFAHFVLADEINRAPAKVQSALLEAMEEHQVTIGDETMPLPDPFLVLATQNPVEQEGTYPLPEAQTDRFMLKVLVDYPTADEELAVVHNHLATERIDLQPVTGTQAIVRARELLRQVYIDERVERYIVEIVRATRTPSAVGLKNLEQYVTYGASPRAGINLSLAARAAAMIEGRGYVVPDDVRGIVPEVLRHRVSLTYEAEADNVSAEDIIGRILAKVKVP
ncbi:MAG: AAA family ATPase [Bacteroidaceae bacterium]|nr:AAA family ATPase [Bacteroidaceae bacterium]